MAMTIKRGRGAAELAAADAKVRATVEAALADIERRGDAAVREMSVQLRQLGPRGLPARARPRSRPASAELSAQDLDDIRFAQAQVRNFAQIQRAALQDVEVETLPGVDPRPQATSRSNAVGCYVPGGKYPLLASAHMSVVTAKVAGVRADRRPARRPTRAGRRPAIVAAQHLAGADEIYCARRHPGGRRDGARHRDASRRSTCWSARATPTSPRPSASCSAASASTCSPARPRRW